ncbi:Serine/threonine-protein kinase PknB [bacterium HR33]|nr:Serine/threonine-protein kinase PknB [bacterium HR33]
MKVCTTCGAEWPDETRFCPNDGSTLRSTGASDLIGSIVAERYHILKKLGEGGMGAVYLGEHVKMGRKSAIKVMSQSMANDPDAIARFNREAANAARINHPNVCAIYDFGETKDGLIYLAMEYIEGEALTDLIDREGALPPRRAANILRQVGDALQAAHDLGIVHRDLKPDNIMITRGRDGSDLVKVVDFGIAKAMGGEEGQKVTKTGLVVGTPEYMSPEQLAGDKLDGRSDLYSLALVFYRMLTGTLPFQADTAQEVMIKRLTDDPMPLNQALPGANFPPRLQEVMDRALQRMPQDRYATVAEFVRDALEAVSQMAAAPAGVDPEGATQLISSIETAATRQLPKTRVAGGRAVTPDTAAPQPAVAVEAAPRTRRGKQTAIIAASAALIALGGGAAALLLSNRNAATEPAGETQPAAAVTQDTASTAGQGAASAGGVKREGTEAASRTTTTATATQAPSGGAPATGTPPGRTGTPEPGIVVNAATASDWLMAKFDLLAGGSVAHLVPGIIDTAMAYFNLPDISIEDKAFAAYVIANAYAEIADRQETLRWAREALRLQPNKESYQALVQAFERGRP